MGAETSTAAALLWGPCQTLRKGVMVRPDRHPAQAAGKTRDRLKCEISVTILPQGCPFENT